jgi:hypothetical protein
MKNGLGQFVCWICLSFCLSGCYPFGPDVAVSTHYELNGQREIKQSDRVLILGTSGYVDEPVKFFTFSVKYQNHLSKLESVQGSYRFYHESPQPLDLKSLTNCVAILIPTANVINKLLPRRIEKPGEIKHGRYEIDITYRLNGQNDQCRFEVDYETKHDTKVYVPGVTKGANWN